MSCKCCVSLRGLAYFSASAHIIVGTKYLVEFVESLFSISQSKLILTETINIVTERLVYRWVFLSLGLLIFQGIDRESKTLLRRSTIIFLVLQALTLAVRLKYGYMYSSMSSSSSSNTFWDSKSDPNPDIYRGLSWGIVATGAYLMILFLYVRKLETNINGGRLFRPNTTATHIPLSTTNLGWYGQSHSSRGSRGHSGNSSGSGALYSPLNFFGGVVGSGFNPLVWTNPGPPPPYSDSAPSSETTSSRSMPPSHPHNIQPCSSRMMMSMSSVTSNDNSTDKILNTSSRTSDRNERGCGGDGDPSAVVPLLDEESDDKNGLEC